MTTTASPADLALSARAARIGIRGRFAWPGGVRTDEQRAALLDWADLHGVRYSEHGECLHWLARGRCPAAPCLARFAACRWLDHVTGWTRHGRPAYLVAHPYGLDVDSLRQLGDLEREWGLTARVDGRGWYGHGTVQVIVQPLADARAPRTTPAVPRS